MKIVVLDAYACVSEDLSFDNFKQLGDLKVYNKTSTEEIPMRIGDAEIVITNKCQITKDVIDKCQNLKYIGVTATGYNIIDVDYCKEKGIVVCNVPAYSTNSVAQQVFAYILYVCNKVEKHDVRVKQGEWQNCEYFCFYETGLMELAGKTIGLIGFGNIAKKVAKLANAFDMDVLVYTRTVKDKYKTEYPCVKFVSLDEMLKKSDFVSVHCPLTKDTENLIRRENIEIMKKTAIFINTSRGQVVNEYDLAYALNNDLIHYACLDVVAVEPILSTNPLLKAKNCLITPHTAWAPKETRERLLGVVYKNIECFKQGKTQNQVNL